MVKKEIDKLVVTRHPALVEYLVKHGLVDKDVQHISHAAIKDVEGKHVFGILPNWLACHAEKMTELQLRLPLEARGKELSLKEIEFYIVEPATYIITEVDRDAENA